MKTFLKKIMDKLKQRFGNPKSPENLVTIQSPENSNNNMAKYERKKPKNSLKTYSKYENIQQNVFSGYDNIDNGDYRDMSKEGSNISTLSWEYVDGHVPGYDT